MKPWIQILKFEALPFPENTLGCYILLENKVLDVITPLVQTDLSSFSLKKTESCKFEIPFAGNLKVILKSMSENPVCIGSVSLKIEFLPKKGFFWVPIYENTESDLFLKDTFEHVGPRILISINKPEENSDFSFIYQLQIKKLHFFVERLEEQLQNNKELYEQEKKIRKKHEKTIQNFELNVEENGKKVEMREISLITLLEKKDKELQEQFFVNNLLKNKAETLEIENETLKSKLERIEINNKSDEIIEKLKSEIDNLKKIIEKKEKTELKLIHDVAKLTATWKNAENKSKGIENSKFLKENNEKLKSITKFKTKVLELTEKNNILATKVTSLTTEKEILSFKLSNSFISPSKTFENKENSKYLSKSHTSITKKPAKDYIFIDKPLNL